MTSFRQRLIIVADKIELDVLVDLWASYVRTKVTRCSKQESAIHLSALQYLGNLHTFLLEIRRVLHAMTIRYEPLGVGGSTVTLSK
jgi:hypothetical protein